MELQVNVTEQEAEELLLALSFRCKQDGIRNTPKFDEIETLGKRLSRIFEKQFAWRDSQGKLRKVFEFYLKKNVTVRVRGNG